MYRISSDPRREESARRLLQALEKRLERKMLDQISVTEVCACAGVSRVTFYRIFDNLSDILEYFCDLSMHQIFCADNPIDLKEATLQSLRVFMDHPAILSALLSNHRSDIIYRSHLSSIQRTAFLNQGMEDVDSSQLDYLLATTSGLMLAYLQTWYHHGNQECPEQVYRYLKENTAWMTGLL